MYAAPIVTRVIQILRLIVQEHKQFGVTEISQALEINKSTVFGILKALQAEGFVVKDAATKRYTMGPGLFDLSTMIFKRTDLATLARPFLQQLAEQVGETVFLGARQNDHVTFLEVVEGKKDLKISSHVGAKIPITAGATGKVIFSFMEENEIISFFREKGLPRHTDASLTDLNRFLHEVTIARKEGYAYDYDEYIKGTMAVAAPIRAGKQLIAVVWIVTFSSVMDEQRLTEVVGRVTATTRLIGKAIQTELVPIYLGNTEEMMKVLVGSSGR
jgi:IclR family transcriptional regulator, KDG regulon repressor